MAMSQVVPQISLAALLSLPPAQGGVLVLISDLGGDIEVDRDFRRCAIRPADR